MIRDAAIDRHRDHARAAIVLAECARLDIRVGTDGCDLAIGPPKGLPEATWRSFRDAIVELRDAVIDQILRKNGRRL
jgi:hypothetical protein